MPTEIEITKRNAPYLQESEFTGGGSATKRELVDWMNALSHRIGSGVHHTLIGERIKYAFPSPDHKIEEGFL